MRFVTETTTTAVAADCVTSSLIISIHRLAVFFVLSSLAIELCLCAQRDVSCELLVHRDDAKNRDVTYCLIAKRDFHGDVINVDALAGGHGKVEMILINENRNLRSMPKFKKVHDFEDLLAFDVSQNSISAVARENFQPFPKLLELLLHKNNLTHIDSDTFDDLQSLEILFLRDNQITFLQPQTFAKLMNLKVASLGRNRLTSIDPALFRNNKQLTNILLNGNKIEYLSVETFEGLRNSTVINLMDNVCVNRKYSGDYSEMNKRIREACSGGASLS